jgi:hypothetical protein
MRAPIRRTGRKAFRVGEIAPIRVEAMIGHLTIMAIAVLGAAACVCAFPDAKRRDYARQEKPSPAESADEGTSFWRRRYPKAGRDRAGKNSGSSPIPPP